MAYSPIDKSSDYFSTKLYDGTGSSLALTGVGHQPDMVWLKNRSSSANHFIVDIVRGLTKEVRPNVDNMEATDDQLITAFGTDGFTVGTSGSGNTNGQNYVAWSWKAGAGQGSSNTDGTINTTYTSVNTTAGTSIVKYTGTGSNATVGHGLGVAPETVWVKKLSGGGNEGFYIYHKSLTAANVLTFQSGGAAASGGVLFNSTDPTSSVFSVGTHASTNASGSTYIAYCFAPKTGFSRFGQYNGNSNANGPFVYTGFKPALVILKNRNTSDNWNMQDDKREGYNPNNSRIFTNDTSAENASSFRINLLSNGFKINNADGDVNSNSVVYMAFAKSPLVTSGNIPATAR